MTTYISREEVMKIIGNLLEPNSLEYKVIAHGISILPSLPDVASQIKEMIRKKIESEDMLQRVFDKSGVSNLVPRHRKYALQELLTEIDSLPPQ